MAKRKSSSPIDLNDLREKFLRAAEEWEKKRGQSVADILLERIYTSDNERVILEALKIYYDVIAFGENPEGRGHKERGSLPNPIGVPGA